MLKCGYDLSFERENNVLEVNKMGKKLECVSGYTTKSGKKTRNYRRRTPKK